MANIKNLRMWDDIRNDSRVSVRKTMLGLKTTAIYQKTQSIINTKFCALWQHDNRSSRAFNYLHRSSYGGYLLWNEHQFWKIF